MKKTFNNFNIDELITDIKRHAKVISSMKKVIWRCKCGNEIVYWTMENGGWFAVGGVNWDGLVEECEKCGLRYEDNYGRPQWKYVRTETDGKPLQRKRQ